ncbi:autotransporter outer membrane beta-barrel domain-containing protein [Vagococcus sp. WN89Y]|uniref:autotransporter outer membrane beta-barrel domain-containing protein n=1 Tax=Vagococcus sp. WN89Y TaxID=3457258 RepID=UPI003FCE158A
MACLLRNNIIQSAKKNNISAKYSFAKISLLSLNIAMCMHSVQAAIISSQIDNIMVSDGDKIIADKMHAGSLYGVMKTNTGTVDLGNNVSISVTAPFPYSADGIFILGDNSNLTANKLSVDVAGDSATGLYLFGKNIEANLGTGSSINVEGGSAASLGVIVNDGSSLKADNLFIQTKGDRGIGLRIDTNSSSADLGSNSKIITNGNSSYGVFISANTNNEPNPIAHLKATALNIDTTGFGAYGINAQPNTVVDLGTGSRIKTHGQYATGIWIFGDLRADALVIDAQGADSNGLEARGGTVNIGAGSHITSSSRGALLANENTTVNYFGTADNRNSLSAGSGFGVSSQLAGSTINLKNTDIVINQNGENSYGIWSLQSGKINGENITITGVAGTQGIYAMRDSQIDLTGNLVINMATVDQVAINTEHEDHFAPSRINATGKMLINGSIKSTGGLVNISMQNGSVWSGSAGSDNVNQGYLNINMNNSRWNVAGNSNLDNLLLENSTVDFSKSLNSGDYSTLKVTNLLGAGSFILRTNIAGNSQGVKSTNDKLIVTGTSAGDHSLTIMNRGNQKTTGKEVLTVVETADGIANFTATSSVELGGYLYDIRKNGNNWELYSSANLNPSSTLTSTADASANLLNVSYILNHAETQTLMQRLGDLRQSGQQGNAWIRESGSKVDVFRNGSLKPFNMTFNSTQFGFDKRVSPKTPLYIGTFMGLTHASPHYVFGNGVVQSHHWGVYSTVMADNGFYIDGSAKLSRLKNTFKVTDSQNNSVGGSTNSSGMSASIEVGNKINLKLAGTSFYIEPQGQFTYSHQNAAKLQATNGLTSKLDSYDSTLGRISALLGYEKNDDNNKVNIYFKSGFIKEFGGNTGYKLNDSSEKHRFKDQWWNNGIGISANLNRAHTIYLEADSTKGGKFHQRKVNGGYRFTF